MKNPGIYILTCKVNGKQYIGKDSNMPSRPNKHLNGKCSRCPLIHRAIKKYGAENFDVEIIRYPGISSDALYAVEQWKIAQLGTKAPNGYNLTDGGKGMSGHKHTEEAKQKIGQYQRERAERGENPMQDPEVAARHSKTLRELAARGEHPMQDPLVVAKMGAKVSKAMLELAARDENPMQDPEVAARQGAKSSYNKRMNSKAKRRYRYRLFAVLLYTRSVMLEYRTRKLHRDGFFDREVPSTDNAEQLLLL